MFIIQRNILIKYLILSKKMGTMLSDPSCNYKTKKRYYYMSSARDNMSWMGKNFLIKNLLVILVLIFAISCSIRNDVRKLDRERQNNCPENMVYIKMDEFMMGRDSVNDESPSHQVSNAPF